jgi:uncharacterized transporter YbjL
MNLKSDIAVNRIKKKDTVIDDVSGDVSLEKGDIVVLTGYRSRLLEASEVIGPEVDDDVVREIITVMGARNDVERLAGVIGYPERQTQFTDLIAVGAGIILGTLIGLAAIHI